MVVTPGEVARLELGAASSSHGVGLPGLSSHSRLHPLPEKKSVALTLNLTKASNPAKRQGYLSPYTHSISYYLLATLQDGILGDYL